MIAVAIGVVIVAMLLMGMFIVYNEERDRIEGIRKDAAATQNDRQKEDLTIVVDEDGNTTITNEWASTTTVRGLMVRCPDGTMVTEEAEFDVGATGLASARSTPGSIADRLAALESQC